MMRTIPEIAAERNSVKEPTPLRCLMPGCSLCSNLPVRKPRWGNDDGTVCPDMYHPTYLGADGRPYQQHLSCKRLSCPVCGLLKRHRDYKRFAPHLLTWKHMFATEVRADQVDGIRKRLERRSIPGLSVPVAEDRNVIFTPVPIPTGFDPHEPRSRLVDEKHMQDALLQRRAERRQLSPYGALKEATRVPLSRTESKAVLVTKKASPKAFRAVMQQLGCEVYAREHDGAETTNKSVSVTAARLKQLLEREENRLRIVRLQARGITMAMRLGYAA